MDRALEVLHMVIQAVMVDLVVVLHKEMLQKLVVEVFTQEAHISAQQDKVMMAVGF